MAAISVIIPCYKSGAFIARTVGYLQAQTFQDFEIILVDDGSPDDTWTVLQALAEQDSRIKVLRQTNAGTGAARNLGLQYVTAPLVTFMDHDDALLPHHLEEYMHYSAGRDLLYTTCRSLPLEDVNFNEPRKPITVLYDSDTQDFRDILAERTFHRMLGKSVWAGVFRMDIIRQNGLIFPPINAEDMFFWLRYCLYVKTVRITNQDTYVWVRIANAQSFSGRNFPEPEENDLLFRDIERLKAYLHCGTKYDAEIDLFMGTRYRAALTKYYKKDTLQPYLVRLRRWHTIYTNERMKSIPFAHLARKEQVFCAMWRSKLYPLFDILLLLLTRLGVK